MCNSHCMTNAERTTTTRSLAFHKGDWMRKALEYAGLSSKDMAEYLDVTPATVSRWLNAKAPVGTQTLRLWALRTGVPISYLQTGINPEDPDPQTEDYQGDVSGQIIHVDFSRERFGVSA